MRPGLAQYYALERTCFCTTRDEKFKTRKITTVFRSLYPCLHSLVPTVSEWNLRFACSEEDVTAAWAFFGKQQPKSVTVADSVLSADVEGHSVKISVGDKGAVLKTSCSCYRTDNPPSWCAHVGAVFLWCSHHVRCSFSANGCSAICSLTYFVSDTFFEQFSAQRYRQP
jgi:hypothetical protein